MIFLYLKSEYHFPLLSGKENVKAYLCWNSELPLTITSSSVGLSREVEAIWSQVCQVSGTAAAKGVIPTLTMLPYFATTPQWSPAISVILESDLSMKSSNHPTIHIKVHPEGKDSIRLDVIGLDCYAYFKAVPTL